MDNHTIKEFREKVLSDLKAEFESYDVPAVLRTVEEGMPTDILTTLHREMGPRSDEVMGEYYFMPVEGEGVDIHCFSVSLTLSEDLPENKVAILQEAIRSLNYYLMDGVFLISPDGTQLIYRCTTVFKMTLPYELAMDMIQIIIGLSLQTVEKWVESLLDLESGDAELEDFMELIPE